MPCCRIAGIPHISLNLLSSNIISVPRNEMTMKPHVGFICLLFICSVLILPANSFAQKKHKADLTWNDWNFRFGPYAWFVGFKGEIIKPPAPSNLPNPPPPKFEIDVGFKDIHNSIKFALMLSGQYRNKHLVTQFNFSSLILESEAITPIELLLVDNVIKLNYYGGDLGIGYRIIKNEKIEWDALLGLKFLYMKITLSTTLAGSIDISGERDHFWADPVLGTNIMYQPHPRLELVGYGDIGPMLGTAYLTYQIMTAANFIIIKNLLLTLGYRYYYIERPVDDAIYTGRILGFFFRIGIQF